MVVTVRPLLPTILPPTIVSVIAEVLSDHNRLIALPAVVVGRTMRARVFLAVVSTVPLW